MWTFCKNSLKKVKELKGVLVDVWSLSNNSCINYVKAMDIIYTSLKV